MQNIRLGAHHEEGGIRGRHFVRAFDVTATRRVLDESTSRSLCFIWHEDTRAGIGPIIVSWTRIGLLLFNQQRDEPEGKSQKCKNQSGLFAKFIVIGAYLITNFPSQLRCCLLPKNPLRGNGAYIPVIAVVSVVTWMARNGDAVLSYFGSQFL